MTKLFSSIFAIMLFHSPAFSAQKIILAVMNLQAHDVPAQKAGTISLLIRNEMNNARNLTVLDHDQTVNAVKEQSGGAGECIDIACAVKAGKALGADKVCIGSVVKVGNNIAVTARVIDVKTGAVDFSETEKSLFESDELYMVQRFCDKLAIRLTGKPLYRIETAEGGIQARAYYPKYRAVKDPLAWTSLGLGIASGFGFLTANRRYANFYTYDEPLYLTAMIWTPSLLADPNAPLLLLLDYYNRRKDHQHAWRVRNTRYYISAGIGGAAVVLLAAFIGRAVNASIQEGKQDQSGTVSLIVPMGIKFSNPVPSRSRHPFSCRLGLAMRF